MAEIMHHLIIGDDEFEIADAFARSMGAYDVKAALVNETAQGDIATFDDGADHVAVKDLTVTGIQAVQSGSGDPSPNNVRPIVGWDSVNIYRTGINQWNEKWEHGYLSTANGENIGSNTDHYRCVNYIPVLPNTKYYFKSNKDIRLFRYDKDKTFLGYLSAFKNTTKTMSSDCYFVRFDVPNGGDHEEESISINYPSTETAYHAYDGETYTIQIGQTAYSGTLDATKGTFIATWLGVNLGALVWTKSSNEFRSGIIQGVRIPSVQSESASSWAKCSQYPVLPATGSTGVHNGNIGVAINTDARAWVYVDGFADFTVDQFKAAMDGVMLVYELTTPVEIQLDPTEVTTLLGLNNIWSDAGAVDVSYHADTKLYIDKAIAALQATILENINNA